jgi:capsid assembly protease
MKHVLSYLCTRPWAITTNAMQSIHDIVARETSLEAVAAKIGKPLENTGGRVEMRGSVAVLSAEGPLFRYANLFTDISGATSIEMFSQAFNAALTNPQVEAILLNVNSPGGEADGVGEMAAMIFDARGIKPITAYVGGIGASGGYWLAAAAERVVMNETAMVGSIGIVANLIDSREAEAKAGVKRYELVSSCSPDKRVDIATDEGRAKMLEMVDAMAEVFVARVAQYRNTTAEHVIANYGKGFVHAGRKALAAGMVDALGSFEGIVAELNTAAAAGNHGLKLAAGSPVASKKEATMADDKQPDVGAIKAQALKDERARIQAILGCEEAKGREGLARHLALETDMDPEVARKALAAAPAAAAAPVESSDQLGERMKALGNPKVGIESDKGDDTENEINAIAGFLPAAQRRRVS